MNLISELLTVDFNYLPVINFVMQQNRVSLIRQLIIENRSENPLNNIKITLSSEPEFSSSAPYHVESIPAKETIRIDSLSLNLSADYFAQLTERLAGNFKLSISSEDVIIYQQLFPVDILAYDQWGGLAVLPEMLSAFITPNHPAIAPIIRRAASILEQWTGNPSLDEYQSRNPDRVRKQMAAIYTAIAEQDIIYSTVPASFEEFGQRIRLVDIIMAQKLATCLDMSLLYASCLEAVGIHSLIIITNGHAFAGGWLIPDTFPDSVIDDVSFLTKRTADGINEITLVETTCMNMGQNCDFDKAVGIANSRLTNISDFILAIDVKRSRFAGIRPIPQRILNGLKWEVVEETKDSLEKLAEAPESVTPYDLTGISQDIIVTKQLLWERKLLDLSLRNNLLNIRVTKNTLQLIAPDLHLLEDALADGTEFRIMSKPADWENPLFNFGLYQKVSESDPVNELISSELTQKRLRSYLGENDLPKALTHLYRSSRTAMEENGANTLYIALGLLRWYETPSSERPRYAPILLLPVEIIRKSAAKGYVIRTREEETMMNITLLEMLRQNFGISISGLDPLPTDESGVNVKLIYSIIRNGIKNQRKWDVEEQAILGIFSFSKFIMWNDIHNNAHKLIENKLVASLMNGKIEWEISDDDMADAAILDKQLSPTDIVLPINADSSQLEAIYEAVNNKTFILHGPPGTGKSQTITNIIANALYRGKRVLFVAEKMAALSVVQNRLASLGLAPFCLELHSNKTKKTAILNQLKETTEAIKNQSPEDFHAEADRLLSLQSEINTYIESLHKKHHFGYSLYDAITTYSAIDKIISITIPQSLINDLNKETVNQWHDALELLISTSSVCGHPYNHPLTGIWIKEYSSALKEETGIILKEHITLLSKVQEKQRSYLVLSDNNNEDYMPHQLTILTDIVIDLLNIPELTPALLTKNRLIETLNDYKGVLPHGKNRDRIKESILEDNSDTILSIEAKQLLSEWNTSSEKWFLPKFFGLRKIKKEINKHRSGKINTEIVSTLLANIIEYQTEEKYITQHASEFSELFGKFGKKESENWQTIEQIIELTANLHASILKYTGDIEGSARIKENIAKKLTDGISSFKSLYGQSLEEMLSLIKELKTSDQLLEHRLSINLGELYQETPEWIKLSIKQLTIWLNNLDKLKDWFQWINVYNKMNNLKIAFVADKYKNENIPTEDILDILTKSLNKAYIEYILSVEPQLELFKGKLFDDVIRRYKQLSLKFEDLTRKELYARLASNIPSFTREASQSSEVGILQRNIRNNARGISIRRLFDQIPILLSRMCPCMLMSPISVAQYIDPDAEKFDLVIFDEASQMPTYEAVGAIARGTNVVIVGDPKQMPPTNFFNVNHSDEDTVELEDLESILDDSLALSIPSKYLLWHYRSKHESLIAFSNSEYYNNKLLTFPSPDNIESKVKLIPIEGHYDKGRSRQNKAEAQAVVTEIARRLKDEKLRKKSIGVVTFSSVQQSLIEDLLSDLFSSNPELEALALESEEPVFIKNLENVQGDERDVILFSVGYGPDKNGRVSMNFGPLNREGGERRLNVAVSRARYEMIIYSTLRSNQIDLNRTSSVGVAGLKRFLEYAETGEKLSLDKNILQKESDKSIESIIANKLQKYGYAIHTDVGCSGYRVDIGIVDKQNPSKYILGILCDGENYKRTKTTRDREIVQNTVLNLLGWNIHRIWTMDWWENPDNVIQDILSVIQEVENGNKLKEKAVIISAESSDGSPQDITFTEDNNKPNVYTPYELKTQEKSLDAFFVPENRNLIIEQINNIIKTEAPVSRSLLCKKILSAWNISRMGQRLDSYFDELILQTSVYQSKNEGLIFLWKDESQYINYEDYRIDSGREVADLPPEEVANAMKYILTNEISLPVPDLLKLTAQLLGFGRNGSNVEAAMNRGLSVALNKNILKTENNRGIII